MSGSLENPPPEIAALFAARDTRTGTPPRGLREVVTEQEATIQAIRARLLTWAEIFDGDGDWTQEDAIRAIREMRQTAEEL